MSPKKAWKKHKAYGDDQGLEASAACTSQLTTSSYEPDEAYNPGHTSTSSLIDRIGPKKPSLLERIELQGQMETVPLDIGVGREEEGEVLKIRGAAYYDTEEDGQVMPDITFQSHTKPVRNGFLSAAIRSPFTHTQPDAYQARKQNFERTTSEDAVVDSLLADSDNNSSTAEQKVPDGFSTNRSAPDTQHASSSRNRLPPPLQPSIGRALRSVVFNNVKLRTRDATINAHKVQGKIDILVTESVSEMFEAQMRKVKDQLSERRPDLDELLNGFGNKIASGVGDNTWLTRRDSRSLVASTSNLPTPPPSELLATENMDRPPPKAPRAMLGIHSPLPPPLHIGLKGKEKVFESPDDGRETRERRSSYSSLRAEPMQDVPPDGAPRSAGFRNRSHRRGSVSRSQSPVSAHRQSFRDEMPTYRSPDRSQIHSLPRRGSLRSHSCSPVPTRSATRSFPTRQPIRSPSRSSARSSRRSRSPPRRPLSHTRSFTSRRPNSKSHSPPPRSTYSNGFHRLSPRRFRSRSAVRDRSRVRTSSGKRPLRSRSPSPGFNSQDVHEKRPRSPSPPRGRRGESVRRRSRSPPQRKRKLSQASPPSRTRSPPRQNRRSPSFGADDTNRMPFRRFNVNAPDSTPSVRNSGRGADSPGQELMSPFGPRPPPPARVPDSSPAPPPAPNHASNPCDKVPGLWLVKVGADTSRVLEGRFIIEPGFAAIWDIASPPPFSARRPVNSKISVSLLCLSTAALTALYISLKPSNPSAESIATAVAKLETAWPQDGTLFLDINKEREGSGGKTWLPFDVDPTSPLDVTEHMQPGPNVIRFIQLTNMEHHTFILYASRPEHTDTPLRDTPPPPNNLNPLFNFHSRTGGS